MSGLANYDQPGDNVFRVSMTSNLFYASMVVEMGTQAEVAAQFPKSYRVRANTLGRETLQSLVDIPAGLSIDETISHPSYGHEHVGQVSITASFVADGVNKGANETGIKRARSFLAKARQLGYTIEWYEPGQPSCIKATRYGGGTYTVADNHLTQADGEARLGL